MGGNALAQYGVDTRRISAAEYHDQLIPAVMGNLRALFPGTRAEVIRSYRNKPDFGDMDVIVDTDTLPSDATQQIIDGLSPAAHYSNGPVLSFEYEDFQIDLIRYPAPVYDFARHYFAYNDLGNLIGRTARRMGFIFGHDGLRHMLRDSDNEDRVVANLFVTQNFADALTFLGFNPDAHSAGFDDLEAIFRYAASTPYFDPDVFLLHNRTHKARMRDKKRPSYTAFLNWLKRERPEPGICVNLSPDEHLQRAKRAFPGFEHSCDEAMTLHERDQAFRRLFNGKRVARLTGLEGKELGRAITTIIEQAGGIGALRETVLDCESQEVLDAYLRELLRQSAKKH